MHNAPMYGPAGMNQTIATYGILPAELAPRFGKGGTILPWGPTGPKITAVRAKHSSELAHKDAAGKVAQRFETEFGSAQLALKTQHGYVAASDHRKDGYPVGF